MADDQNKSVNLSEYAGVSQANSVDKTQKPKRSQVKKKKPPISSQRKIIIAFLLAVLGIVFVFLVWFGAFVYKNIKEPATRTIDFPLIQFTGTPDEQRDKSEYYVVGLFGENENESSMEMLSYVSIDKVARTVNILQLPSDTYVKIEGSGITAERAADVWANPTPLTWCDTEQKSISPGEVEDNKHVGCGGIVTEKRGSAAGDLCKIFNLEYNMPVDGYILFSQESLVKLVNQLGGIDINLEDKMTVGEVTYPKGPQTLDGDAALSYAKRRNDGIKGDAERLVRIRKVFAALFDRLEAQGVEMMNKNSIGPVMNGSTPLRIYMPKTKEEENLSHREILMNKIYEYRDIPAENIRAFVLPGTSKKLGKTTYYSPNKAQVLKLLNSYFLPHLSKLSESDLAYLPDFAGGTTSEMYEQVFSDFVVPQTNLSVITEAE